MPIQVESIESNLGSPFLTACRLQTCYLSELHHYRHPNDKRIPEKFSVAGEVGRSVVPAVKVNGKYPGLPVPPGVVKRSGALRAAVQVRQNATDKPKPSREDP